jgi:hypothetical protein
VYGLSMACLMSCPYACVLYQYLVYVYVLSISCLYLCLVCVSSTTSCLCLVHVLSMFFASVYESCCLCLVCVSPVSSLFLGGNAGATSVHPSSDSGQSRNGSFFWALGLGFRASKWGQQLNSNRPSFQSLTLTLTLTLALILTP